MKKIFYTAILCFTVVSSFAFDFRLVTSEPLRSSQQELKVKGRQGILIKQKLSFGDYHTTGVKRSAIKKWTMSTGIKNFIWGEHVEGKQSIRFNLTDNMHNSEVYCLSNIESDDLLIGHEPGQCAGQVTSILRIGTGDNENNYSVAIYMDNDTIPWELFLSNNEAQYSRENYIGYVSRGKEYYTITPVWKIQKKNGREATLPFGSAGFEIRNSDGIAKAAVSLIDNGVVYMGQLPGDEKFLMANICAALLLQSDISQ